MTGPTAPELERLRRAYDAEATATAADIDGLIRQVQRRHRAGQMRRAVVGAATVAAITVGIGVTADRLSPAPQVVPSPAVSGPTSQPTPPGEESTVVSASAVDDLYRRLDAVYGLGFYIVDTRTDPGAVTVWADADQLGAVAGAARPVSERHHVPVTARPRDELTRRPPVPEADLSRALSELKELYAEHPDAGYSSAKLEVPFGRIVLWRTTATSVDVDALAVAAAAGATLEIRTADFALSDLEKRLDELMRANEQWRRDGFAVTGGQLRPTGAVVTIEGDVRAAENALSPDAMVRGVVEDVVVSLPAQVPGASG